MIRLRTSFVIVICCFFLERAALGLGYVTGFEDPPFKAEVLTPTFMSGAIDGQDGWTTSANPETARIRTATDIAVDLTNAGLNPDMPVHGGSQALYVSGAGANNPTIRVIQGLELEQIVILDVWARPLTSGSLGNIFLTMEDNGGDRAAAFRFGPGNSIDYGTAPAANPWQPTGDLWSGDSWYRFTMSVNYSTKSYDFAVDGVLKRADVPFYSAASDFFSQIRIFRGANQAGMIVDNLAVVPEPATLGSLLAGGALVFRRRRIGGS
jgi:hypothetical protein